MRFVVYCIELAKKDRDKADAILHKYYVNNDIDVKHAEYSRRGDLDTVQYWLTCIGSDKMEIIVNELEEAGIELF